MYACYKEHIPVTVYCTIQIHVNVFVTMAYYSTLLYSCYSVHMPDNSCDNMMHHRDHSLVCLNPPCIIILKYINLKVEHAHTQGMHVLVIYIDSDIIYTTKYGIVNLYQQQLCFLYLCSSVEWMLYPFLS